MPPHEKKSETLEVRVPPAAKQAFMARCRSEGRSASDVVRELIDGYLARSDPLSKEHFMKPRLLYPAALAVALGAAGVLAATSSAAGPDLRPLFAQLDRNGDGAISLPEFAARHGGHGPAAHHAVPQHGSGGTGAPFGEGDANRDGRIDYAEFATHHREMASRTFASMDADGDGRVTRAELFASHAGAGPELQTALNQTFASFDADRDGGVSRAEFEAR